MLLDPQLMAACVPGMQSVEVLSPTEYTAQIQVKIAFITARFKLRTTIVEQRAPQYLRTEGTGEDTSVASALKQTSELFLTDLGDGRTELRTRVLVDVTGRLGSFGLSVMKTKADRMWDEFCANLVQRVGDAAGVAAPAAPVAATPATQAPAARTPVVESPAAPPPAQQRQAAPARPAPASAAPQAAAAVAGSSNTAAAPSTATAGASAMVPTRGFWTRILDAARGDPYPATPASPSHHHIRVELRRAGSVLTVEWPLQGSAECLAWLREVAPT
jgi:carbon monoxide dehydrogenase subunit G